MIFPWLYSFYRKYDQKRQKNAFSSYNSQKVGKQITPDLNKVVGLTEPVEKFSST